jgi:hypothetical protein
VSAEDLNISCACGAAMTFPAEYSAQQDMCASMIEVFLDAHKACREQQTAAMQFTQRCAVAVENIDVTLNEFLQMAQAETERGGE